MSNARSRCPRTERCIAEVEGARPGVEIANTNRDHRRPIVIEAEADGEAAEKYRRLADGAGLDRAEAREVY